MINNHKIKEQLLQECNLFAEKRMETIRKIIEANKNDLISETKSSAGDKHETGRAMIQLEMEKASQQLSEVQLMQEVLQRIDIKKLNKKACLGSLIKTTTGIYFLAISVGQVKVENTIYFIVSSLSPIGKQLLGKEVGDTLLFKNSKILEIV
jgi:transcription elongation GreA/GreB family factor